MDAVMQRVQLQRDFFPHGVTPNVIKLLDRVQQLLEQSGEPSQRWSNQTAFGYAILASERIGMPEDEIQRLVRGMHTAFDRYTLEEAAEHYRKSPY